MKKYKKWIFKAWEEQFSHETTIALCYNRWFEAALNCCRDGDMGAKDEEGFYERIWWGDEVGTDNDVRNYRNASVYEVEAYIKRCGINVAEWQGEAVAIVIGEDESYVLVEIKE